MKLIALCLVSCFTLSLNQSNQTASKATEVSSVKWYTFSEAVEASKSAPKKIMVDIYTTWCAPCKKMDKEVFSDPKVAAYLNANFYPVKFDGESKELIVFEGEKYKFSKKEGVPVHELVWKLTNDKNKLEFPSMVFLDENRDLIKSTTGYREKEKFMALLETIKADKR